MDRRNRIILSAIAAAVIISASVSFTWLWPNSTRMLLPPTNSNEAIVPVESNGTDAVDTNMKSNNDAFRVIPDSNLPTVSDPNLRVEKVVEGLSLPTSMKFVGHNDILILEKASGTVRLILNGILQPHQIFQKSVESNSERGMLGVAVSGGNGNGQKTVFLYYTEPSQTGEVRNRIYKYDWDGRGNLTGGKMILDLPGTPGPNHDGGKIVLGSDGMLYAVIGDQNRRGMDQNVKNGPSPDDTSVIFRIDQNGNAASNNPLSDNDSAVNTVLSKYYAYGIRNSFGLAFDPVTGKLWDTENGPSSNDEINIVSPGFNSGWTHIMGPIGGKSIDSLVQFKGSHYQDPVFTWTEPPAVTDIEFYNSTKLGDKYTNNIFVGDFNNGNLYFFTVNKERNGLVLDGNGLQDQVANTPSEASTVTFGTGFTGGITDIETGPDGYLYILTHAGNLYRIVPAR